MARRISIGVATRGLGNINVVDDRVFTAGVGDVVEFGSNLQLNTQNDLRFADSDSSNWVAFQAPSSISANVTWTLPAADGPSNFVLTTNGNGTLSWSEKGVEVVNNTTDSNLNYPLFTNQTTGEINTTRITSSRMDFQPSTGRFRLLANVASSSTTTGALVVTGGVGIGGQMTAASIVETSSIALKQNVEPIRDALAAVTQLKGVTYDRRDTQEHEAGLIAEWVDQVLPDLVTRDCDGGVIGIKYTKLTAYLIEAVKALKTEIDELKNR